MTEQPETQTRTPGLSDTHRELLEFITSAHVERNPALLTRICHHATHLLTEEQVRKVLGMVKT